MGLYGPPRMLIRVKSIFEWQQIVIIYLYDENESNKLDSKAIIYFHFGEKV